RAESPGTELLFPTQSSVLSPQSWSTHEHLVLRRDVLVHFRLPVPGPLDSHSEGTGRRACQRVWRRRWKYRIRQQDRRCPYLDNRFFKPIIKLPDTVSGLEPELESILRERLGRGSITFILKLRSDSAEAAYHINTQALKSYLEQLQSVKGLDRLVTIDLASLVQLPGVCQEPRDESDE